MTFCRARALLLLWYMRLCRARYKWTGRAENVINPVVLNLGRTVLAYFGPVLYYCDRPVWLS